MSYQSKNAIGLDGLNTPIMLKLPIPFISSEPSKKLQMTTFFSKREK